MRRPIVEELEPLFNPKSVAVIGATNNWNKWGYSTFTSVLGGFRGPVYPVNNKESEVLGHKAYVRVTDIPGPVDLAVSLGGRPPRLRASKASHPPRR
ncbi:MAG: hypothetical protein FJ006_11530 [Chloroflexi bacterium]|nr:hypothetical protein [Chloroflexota bacterium]